MRLRLSIKRTLAVWLIAAVSLFLLAWILPGLTVDDPYGALAAAALIGILNALLWPALVFLTLPLNLLTFGAFTLVLNGLIVWLVSMMNVGMTTRDLFTAIVTAIGLAAINTLFSSLFAFDDDDSYYRHVLQKKVRRRLKPEATGTPGVIFLEIDGLAKSVLLRAMRNGQAPTLERWLDGGSHRLTGWECDLSSQTAASQAGILLGNNFDIPAFRWYEKDTGKTLVSSSLKDIAVMEERQSRGDGLLTDGGISLSNMYSGDTANCFFTMSRAREKSDFQKNGFYLYLIDPYNFLRGTMLAGWDIMLELRSQVQQRRRHVTPRLEHRERSYPFVRAATTTVLRELSVYTLIGEMLAGFPVAYVTLFGYDEVAHHSGVERDDALEVLRKIDQQIARLEAAAAHAPRPYRFVILSDHGQSQGATFRQRYGITLEDLVRQLVAGAAPVAGSASVDEHWSYISTPLTDAVQSERQRLPVRVLRRMMRSRMHDGEVVLGPDRERQQGEPESTEGRCETAGARQGNAEAGEPGAQGAEPESTACATDETIVMASGNLGLIYFKAQPGRMSREAIEAAFPDLLQGLAGHPGIGFVMVRSERDGPVAIGADGEHFLADGRIEGEDPLAVFGPNAASHLLRTDGFPHVADIMVNSFYEPETDEVAAFEELIGSHGGLGGDQARPFVLFPADWELPPSGIVGAEQLHLVMKGWVDRVARQSGLVAAAAVDGDASGEQDG